MTYCTYLTVYSGNKLPPFYIGYTSLKKIDEGYHGSVSSTKWKTVWLKELKEHPERFKTKIITQHNTREEARSKEREFQLSLKVVKSSMYINEAIAGERYGDRTGQKASSKTREKIRQCLLNRDPKINKQIGNTLRGRSISEETKRKISQTQTGMKRKEGSGANISKGKMGKCVPKLQVPKSDEHKAAISAALKGKKKSPEHVAKMRGSKRSEETKRKMREASARRWSKS